MNLRASREVGAIRGRTPRLGRCRFRCLQLRPGGARAVRVVPAARWTAAVQWPGRDPPQLARARPRCMALTDWTEQCVLYATVCGVCGALIRTRRSATFRSSSMHSLCSVPRPSFALASRWCVLLSRPSMPSSDQKDRAVRRTVRHSVWSTRPDATICHLRSSSMHSLFSFPRPLFLLASRRCVLLSCHCS